MSGARSDDEVTDGGFGSRIKGALEHRRQLSQDRHRTIVEHLSETQVVVGGKRLVNFCSNNYLGLTKHPKIVAAMEAALCAHGTGSGASGLISGHSPAHDSAERAIAKWKGTEASVLLPSGYQANHAAIQTIAAVAEQGAAAGGAALRDVAKVGRVRFLFDKLVHASLIDAVLCTKQAFRTFPHNDLAKLKRLLDEADADELQVVVTESIFSMDGDAVDLRGLAELKRQRPFVLMLDEAHACGVYGDGGAGYAAELGLRDSVDVSIMTLSKAMGLGGGAICGSASFCEAVINFGRAYIYSTAIAPVLAAGAEAAIEVMRDEPERQQRVRELARRVRTELRAAGLSLAAGDSPIIPVILGEERRVAAAAKQLLDAGMLVIAVRPPTVPKGTSRLRVTVSSAHSDGELKSLLKALAGLSTTDKI